MVQKEENTEDKERIKENRRLKRGKLRNHEKKYRFKCVLSVFFKLAGMIPYVATNSPHIRKNRSFFKKR